MVQASGSGSAFFHAFARTTPLPSFATSTRVLRRYHSFGCQGEWRCLPKKFLIRRHLDLLRVAFEHDEVTLINHTDLRHLALISFGQHIGLDRVVLQVRPIEEDHPALDAFVVDRFNQRLVAILVANLEPEPRGIPGQRRVGEGRRRFERVRHTGRRRLRGVFGQLGRFEVLLIGRSGSTRPLM